MVLALVLEVRTEEATVGLRYLVNAVAHHKTRLVRNTVGADVYCYLITH